MQQAHLRLRSGALRSAGLRRIDEALTVSGQGISLELSFCSMKQGHGNTVRRKAHYKHWQC
ncbi:hypothetical protein CN934_27380 [Ensifer sp. MMN_5]|nr:hypothetical protein CN934_27380 [Ensifer sp. MMN_5]